MSQDWPFLFIFVAIQNSIWQILKKNADVGIWVMELLILEATTLPTAPQLAQLRPLVFLSLISIRLASTNWQIFSSAVFMDFLVCQFYITFCKWQTSVSIFFLGPEFGQQPERSHLDAEPAERHPGLQGVERPTTSRPKNRRKSSGLLLSDEIILS